MTCVRRARVVRRRRAGGVARRLVVRLCRACAGARCVIGWCACIDSGALGMDRLVSRGGGDVCVSGKWIIVQDTGCVLRMREYRDFTNISSATSCYWCAGETSRTGPPTRRTAVTAEPRARAHPIAPSARNASVHPPPHPATALHGRVSRGCRVWETGTRRARSDACLGPARATHRARAVVFASAAVRVRCGARSGLWARRRAPRAFFGAGCVSTAEVCGRCGEDRV